MDLRGQLFVENVVRNIATSMKDIKFLDFMYKNLQWNETGFNKEIPLVSYCGKEMNFVTPIDKNSVLVYKELLQPTNQGDGYKLLYGGTIRQNFDPSRLAFSTETGRMYHELLGHKNITGNEKPVYGPTSSRTAWCSPQILLYPVTAKTPCTWNGNRHHNPHQSDTRSECCEDSFVGPWC
jgi:hypothetical protein